MVMTAEATKTKSSKVDWKTVRGLMVDAIYGGRVDNPHDMRVLATYLRRYFNSDVVSARYPFQDAQETPPPKLCFKSTISVCSECRALNRSYNMCAVKIYRHRSMGKKNL